MYICVLRCRFGDPISADSIKFSIKKITLLLELSCLVLINDLGGISKSETIPLDHLDPSKLFGHECLPQNSKPIARIKIATAFAASMASFVQRRLKRKIQLANGQRQCPY